jgi:D-alanyl-lipoteichoic acid acyltransferase DltB (MBOAT superfamily)
MFLFLFLPITLIGYFALLKKELIQPAKTWLFLCSLYFYGHWNLKYLILIVGSILINFSISNVLMEKDRSLRLRKSLFIFSLFFNIGLLCFFKYMDFFIENINIVAGTDIGLLNIILPLGISFFTLQQIAFIVDVYTGLAKENKFIDYALFVSFFPQLIAGPIVHYKEIIPQFQDDKNKKFSSSDFSKGLYIFVIGLFKKVMIADSLSGYVGTAFDQEPTLHFFAAWGANLAYAFQIYFDFSGYTDMAIGLGRMFNIKIPTNFKSPYKTTNIVEFWSRWHITLTNFITAYIFTPLVRSMPKMTFGYMMFSMFLAMTIAGLWHGAAWTFVIFGVLHGGAIVIHHNWKKRKIKLPKWLAWFITFNFVSICFTMFRATSVESALKVYKGMLGLSGFVMPKGLISTSTLRSWDIKYGSYMTNDENLILALIIIGFFIVLRFKNSNELLDSFTESKTKAFMTAGMFVLCIFGLNRLTEFIYFNF